VFPIRGGTNGPIDTFGYPTLPTKTLGGEAPCTIFAARNGFSLFCEWYRTRTGHRDFPQSSFVPLQSAHNEVEGDELVVVIFLKTAFCGTVNYQLRRVLLKFLTDRRMY